MEDKIKKEKLLNNWVFSNNYNIDQVLKQEPYDENKVIVVLDDDPTGIQTVHDVNVYMEWSKEVLVNAFKNDKLFYIHTNSRAMKPDKVKKINTLIMKNILSAAGHTGKEFVVISRSDSTLRGYYPLETNVLKNVFEKETDKKINGEVIVPFFPEGGRYTFNDIHYVEEDGYLIPAGKTEYAQDPTFGYKSSDLKNYIYEKTTNRYSVNQITSISLDMIRKEKVETIEEVLMNIKDFNKVIVNVLTYRDLKKFILGLKKAEARGKRFLFRTAASFVKAYGGLKDKKLLNRNDFSDYFQGTRGLIIVGSFVKKSTEQLKQLLKCKEAVSIKVNVIELLNSEQREKTINSIIESTQSIIQKDKTPVIYTSRELVTEEDYPESTNLDISKIVSDSLVKIISDLQLRPDYIISKGGITSSDIAVKALGIRKALVLGQIQPGVPAIISGEDSKWSNVPYIIFPGNVGNKDSLKEAFKMLKSS